MDINKNYVSGEKVCCNFSVYSSNNMIKIRPKKFRLLSYKLSLVQNYGINEKILMSVHGIDGIGYYANRVDQKLKLMTPVDGIFRSMYYFIKLEICIEVNGVKKSLFRYKRVRLNDCIFLHKEKMNII